VHTVIETPAFLASAADEGIGEEERTAMVAYIAAHPTAGDVMQGTGGARKLRFAGRSKGKSGGYRAITFHVAEDIPVFLLDVYAKDSQANLSKAQRNELRKLLTALPRVWRQNRAARVADLRTRR
jgi:hypothetical protein